MKKLFKRIYKFLVLIGIDLLKSKDFIFNLFWYIKSLSMFNKLGQVERFKLKLYPILGENKMSAGSTNSHYFIQDLFVAQNIFKDAPKNILDVGSRIDGFVSNIATYRKIDILDIRPINKKIDNMLFKQLDFTGDISELIGKYNCVTCLHAIEHFGLGRYGDVIDPNGHLKGIENLSKILKEGGVCYLSFPIGENRIEFNAHRVFSLEYIIPILNNYFEILSFNYISDKGVLHQNVSIDSGLKTNFNCHYGCAIFKLSKSF